VCKGVTEAGLVAFNGVIIYVFVGDSITDVTDLSPFSRIEQLANIREAMTQKNKSQYVLFILLTPKRSIHSPCDLSTNNIKGYLVLAGDTN
jgi:hypothetical protein